MLDALQLDRFVGIAYCPRHMDCADLALLVQRELFGREVVLAGKRPRPLGPGDQAAAMAAYCSELGLAVAQPQDGDAVLMRDAGTDQAGHIGIYVFTDYAPQVLHASHKLGASVLHRLQDLAGYGLAVEGYYRWK
ncbi:hypothetical protein DJFAAGMI_01264 [Comamonas sp. PE63]|uniref:NlpC/P60 domain-containing protein n=1 Tax=Comamonas brasiliensis TaxID=1812482 RepID=A0ABS5LR47_9BURK|nr:hypothetical protein [Comamonas sp. PE63]MBS3018532.1 hypothetical protein [Comamonas sp. PE63]